MKKFKPHPAAEIFPMAGEDKIKAVAASMLKIGQLDPVVLHPDDDRVVDGRTRQAAGELVAKEQPDFELDTVYWDGEGSITDWVIAKNLDRRHLTPDEQVAAALAALPLYEAEAKARQKAGGLAPQGAKASEVVAEKFGVAPRTLERAKSVSTKAPELAAKVHAGEMTWKQAEKKFQHGQRVAEVKAYRPPEGEFPVITVDPPWKYDDELDGSDQVRGGITYPPMEIEEIAAMKLPVSENCAVFLWVTNSHLIDPDGYAVVARAWRERYGLVPKQIRTWRKVTLDGTKDRLSGGHVWRNNTEHLVRLERGKPVFNKVTQPTFFDAPRSPVHSEKPNMAYEDILALCPAQPRLEMFSRKERPGWVTSGSEVQAKTKQKRKKLVFREELAK